MLIRSVASLAILAQVVATTIGVAAAAVPSNDTLYPQSTKAFFSVPNVPQLVGSWEKTQLHQLFEDPVMKPFTEDIRRQLQQKWLSNHERIGLSIDDLRDIASGELSGGLIELTDPKEHTAFVILVDITGNEEKATQALAKADANLVKEKAKISRKTISGVSVTVYDIPAKEDREENRQVAYFLDDGLLAASAGESQVSALAALTDVLARRSGKLADNLSTLEAFQHLNQQLATDANGLTPDVRWYFEPHGVFKARARGNDKRAKNLKIFENQGFTALQGIGGFVNLGIGEYEVLHRTAIYAPKPFEKAMGMFAFPNATPATPPEWVPGDLVTFTSVNWEIKTAFERFSTLFDELFGEGSEGTFNDMIDSVRDDPNGPGIDMRKDLIGHLGTRVVVLTDNKLPITTSSERFIVAIEATDEKALAAAVRKSLETDETVARREFGDYIIWEMKAEEEALTSIVVEHPDDPAGAAEDSPEGKSEKIRDKLADEREEPVQLPNAAVAVARGHLFVSSHVDFLEKILSGVSDRDKLESDADFQRVNEELKKLGANEVCVRNFTRADEQFRITYDLFKAGKLPESETVLAQIIRSSREDRAKATTRKPEFDGSKLPDYQVARRYLGYGGSYVTTVDKGWSVVGFLYRKNSGDKDLAAAPESLK